VKASPKRTTQSQQAEEMKQRLVARHAVAPLPELLGVDEEKAWVDEVKTTALLDHAYPAVALKIGMHEGIHEGLTDGQMHRGFGGSELALLWAKGIFRPSCNLVITLR
jgi:hypothetical protein